MCTCLSPILSLHNIQTGEQKKLGMLYPGKDNFTKMLPQSLNHREEKNQTVSLMGNEKNN